MQIILVACVIAATPLTIATTRCPKVLARRAPVAIHHPRQRTGQLAQAIIRVRGIRTRREFAEQIGVTEQTIYNWETSRTTPTLIVHAHALYQAGVPAHLLTGYPNADP